MRRAALVLCVAGLCACGGGNLATELAKPPEYAPDDQTKCKVKASQAKPLIVEWPSADRGELEATVSGLNVVVVAYDGCEMRLLSHCKAPGKYRYTALTPKQDTVRITTDDELYATIPMYAAKFEGKLAASGQLNVAMTLVGRYLTDRIDVSQADLEGRCEGATHIIAGLTAGAFEFFAGADAEVGGGVHVLDASAGAVSRAKRETLTRDGDDQACAKAGANDAAPPGGCGALLRVEVLPLGGSSQRAVACPDGTEWDGARCVGTEVVKKAECPDGSEWDGNQCVRKVSQVDCPGGTSWNGRTCVAKVDTTCNVGTHFVTGMGCVADRSPTAQPRTTPKTGTIAADTSPNVMGSLDKKDISETIRGHMTQLRYCYEKQLKRSPTLAGKVVVRFSIAPNGKVTSARAVTSLHPTVDHCVVATVGRMVFPKPKGGGMVTVSYPLVFRPTS